MTLCLCLIIHGATSLVFDPYAHGVDISIQAATKYIVGHSDAMLGTITANEKHWSQLYDNSFYMGYTAAPDDIKPRHARYSHH